MLNIAQQIIGYTPNVSIPTHLIEREFNVTNLLIPVIILSFSLITLSKYRNTRIISILSKLLLSSKNLDYVLKEEMRLNSISSVSLIINYTLVLNACFFLTFYHILHYSASGAIFYSFLTTFGMISIQIVGLWFVGVISDESKVISIPIIETVILYETFGIIMFFLSLCWVLNPQYSYLFLNLFIGVLLLEIIIRYSKCTIAVLKTGMTWYYIILYLCTLEILPLVVVYFIIKENFNY